MEDSGDGRDLEVVDWEELRAKNAGEEEGAYDMVVDYWGGVGVG